VLLLQLIHYLSLDRHDARGLLKVCLGFVVLEVAVAQGGRVYLLLADKLLHARFSQHLTLLLNRRGLAKNSLIKSLRVNKEFALGFFALFVMTKIILLILQGLLSHLFPQLFRFDQGVVRSVRLGDGVLSLNLRLFRRRQLNFRLWDWLGFRHHRRLTYSFHFFRR